MFKKLWDKLVNLFKKRPKDVIDAIQELNKDTPGRKAVQISSEGLNGIEKIKFILKKCGWSEKEIETVIGELWPKKGEQN